MAAFFMVYRNQKLNSGTTDERCDATTVEQRTGAGYKK